MTGPEPTLRRAVPADAAALSLLGGATFLHTFAHNHPGDGLIAHMQRSHSESWYARTLADPVNALWIMETPLAAPVGYAMLCPPEIDHPHRARDLELKRIYMLGPWMGGGHGRRLIAAVEEEARTRGADRVLLCVYEFNAAAKAFYTRLGYADSGLRQDFMVGDAPFTDEIWAKPIA